MKRIRNRGRIQAIAFACLCLAALGALGGTTYALSGTTCCKFTDAKLLNGWHAGGYGTAPPGYAKDALGVVHMRGSVVGGPEGDEAFVLPKALAPSHNVWLPTFSSTSIAGLEIASTGQAIPIGPTTKYYQPMDGMNYVAGSATKVKFTDAKLLNGWRSGGVGSAQPGYAIDSLGVVHLRGGLAGTTSGLVAFVLPKALAPSLSLWVPIYTEGATEGSLYVSSNGQVTPRGSEAINYASLDGITFVAGSATKIGFINARLLNHFKPAPYGSAPPGYARTPWASSTYAAD